MTDTTTLRCPFCGSEAQVDEHEGRTMSRHYTASVSCTNCERVSHDAYGETELKAKENAILMWNTRYVKI